MGIEPCTERVDLRLLRLEPCDLFALLTAEHLCVISKVSQ